MNNPTKIKCGCGTEFIYDPPPGKRLREFCDECVKLRRHNFSREARLKRSNVSGQKDGRRPPSAGFDSTVASHQDVADYLTEMGKEVVSALMEDGIPEAEAKEVAVKLGYCPDGITREAVRQTEWKVRNLIAGKLKPHWEEYKKAVAEKVVA